MHHEGTSAILSDIDADNFDVAFELFRPGESDNTSKLSQEEMENMISFTRNLFTPTTHEQVADVAKRVDPNLWRCLDPSWVLKISTRF